VEGEGGTTYYQKTLDEGTESWDRMKKLLKKFAAGRDLRVQGTGDRIGRKG
jgi:hypothetical protein